MAIIAATDAELAAYHGISTQARKRVALARQKMEDAPQIEERLHRMGAAIIPFEDPRYPVLLKQIDDPPGALFVRGDLLEQDQYSIAIVGSRRPRPYGMQMAGKVAGDLVRAGFVIVSGGARGIDASAHEAALSAGGRTISVLGCGIDLCYPPEHKDLFARIAEQGAVVSEFPLGAAPEAWRFPRRNRIISGLSKGVIVCDAAEDSGALITATCAAEQNRDVFAVPGNVDSGNNRGAHRLLKEGAKLVENAEDVLSEYGLESVASREGAVVAIPPIEISPEERRILEMLNLDPLPLDTIIDRANMSASDVSGLLTFLEMKRLVKRVAGPAYVRMLR